MQRRLNLAVALIHEPRLLVLDEPTVGVDPQSRSAILDRLAELRSSGVAILYTSHYMDEIERFCDVVGIIDQGKVVAEGTPRRFLSVLHDAHRIDITATGNIGDLASAVFLLPGVSESRVAGDGLHVVATDAPAILAGIVAAAASSYVQITSIDVIEPNLEQVFLHLTGRELRD